MFHGTTPSCVRDYLGKELSLNTPKRFFEPFAGNFVMSLACGAIDKKIKVISGDVNIHSVALGCAYAGKDSGIRLTEAALERMPFFRGKDSPTEIAATVMIWEELAIALSKQHIRYYKSMVNNIDANIEKYMLELTTKIDKVRKGIGESYSFHAQDAVITMKDANGPQDAMLYDPPYYIGDYEKMYKETVSHFQMPDMPYTTITNELKLQHLEELRQKEVRTFFRAEEVTEIPGYQLVFEYLYKTNKKYYLYSNKEARASHGWKEVFRTKRSKHDVLWGKDLSPGLKAEFVPVANNIANYYRTLWTKKAVMRDSGMMWLVVVGGKVCGVVAISHDTFNRGYATIIADAAPLNTPYRRLGKLVLMMVLTDEFRETVNKRFMLEHERFITLAYTDSPVSMKYRGLMELLNRQVGAPSGHKYQLTYRSGRTFPNETVQQGYDQWYQQYGEIVKES